MTAEPTVPTQPVSQPNRGFSDVEKWLAPAYFTVYMGYLFWSLEGEVGHWASMVLLPLLLILILNRGRKAPLRSALESVGLRRGNLSRGLLVTLVLGVVLGVVQLFMSRSGAAALEAFRNGTALYLFPLSFVLMLGMAGFTEEFFFRGFLQARFEALTGSKLRALLLASVLFGIYHLPYAYFNPNWPSAGDWGAAWASAMGQGVMGGLVLGGLFIHARGNLVAPILLHALVDAFPVMGMIKFGGG